MPAPATDPVPAADPASAADRPDRTVWAGRAAVVVFVLALAAHVGALVTRGVAADRMPWGNMYEFILSVTFVGAAAWSSYNGNYRSYAADGGGGDCTNFISQIMGAGGWARVGSWPGDDRTSSSNWFYGDYTWSTSYSWPAAENWYRFAIRSGRTSLYDNVWKMWASDVLQLRWHSNEWLGHSQFANARAGSGTYADELYMTQHTNDYHNKPLSSILAANPTVAGWVPPPHLIWEGYFHDLASASNAAEHHHRVRRASRVWRS